MTDPTGPSTAPCGKTTMTLEQDCAVLMQALACVARQGNQTLADKGREAIDRIKVRQDCRYQVHKLKEEVNALRDTNERLTNLVEELEEDILNLNIATESYEME